MKPDEIKKQLQELKALIKKQNEKPLNLVQTAQYLSISQSHLYKLTSQRKIPSHKPNGKYLYFFKEELDEWVRSGQCEKVKWRSEEPESSGEEEEEDEKPP